jgi:hypothetical protein
MPKCKKCKKPILKDMDALEVLGGKWCPECFVCKVRGLSTRKCGVADKCTVGMRGSFHEWPVLLAGREAVLSALLRDHNQK